MHIAAAPLFVIMEDKELCIDAHAIQCVNKKAFDKYPYCALVLEPGKSTFTMVFSRSSRLMDFATVDVRGFGIDFGDEAIEVESLAAHLLDKFSSGQWYPFRDMRVVMDMDCPYDRSIVRARFGRVAEACGLCMEQLSTLMKYHPHVQIGKQQRSSTALHMSTLSPSTMMGQLRQRFISHRLYSRMIRRIWPRSKSTISTRPDLTGTIFLMLL